MALNEAISRKRGGLTKLQKREAEAAVYGLLESSYVSSFSTAEIENMRRVLAQYDQSANGGIKEFDLNHPPKDPYVHQEFPRMMYRGTATKVAQSADEMQDAEANGWNRTPSLPVVQASAAFDAETEAEVDAINAKIVKRKGA